MCYWEAQCFRYSQWKFFSWVIFECTFIFSEDRIRSGIKKLTKARQGSTQGRLDSFFKVLPSPCPASKRKVSKLILLVVKGYCLGKQSNVWYLPSLVKQKIKLWNFSRKHCYNRNGKSAWITMPFISVLLSLCCKAVVSIFLKIWH